jgi:hypothetical protein
MKKNQIKTALIIIYVLATAYSFLRLPNYSLIGGPCNAGLVFVFIGFFLLLCTTLTTVSLVIIFKKTQRSTAAITLSIVSFAIWLGLTAILFSDNREKTLIYCSPFLIMTILTTVVALRKNFYT